MAGSEVLTRSEDELQTDSIVLSLYLHTHLVLNMYSVSHTSLSKLTSIDKERSDRLTVSMSPCRLRLDKSNILELDNEALLSASDIIKETSLLHFWFGCDIFSDCTWKQ